MIAVDDNIVIDEREIEEHFIRASGPGGQNVNKLSTAVQLRFDVRHSSLPREVKARLLPLAGRRMTVEGVLVIAAQNHRTQEANRREARARLFDLIRRAAVAPKLRRPTKPTRSSKRRRLDSKTRHGRTKSLRGRVEFD